MQNNKNRKKIDNRGAALLYVIITVALILIFCTTITMAAYLNLRATMIQEESDDNFYSADKIGNSILNVMESKLSHVYNEEYTKLVTSKEFKNMNNETAKQTLKDNIANRLVEILHIEDPSNKLVNNNYCDLSKIQAEVSKQVPADVNYFISSSNGKSYLDKTEDSLTIRNIHIVYVDELGIYDEITTDLKIKLPEVDLKPRVINKYASACVADNGLGIGLNSGLQVYGDLYANTKEGSNDPVVLVDYSGKLDVIPKYQTVIKGTMETKDNAKVHIHEENPGQNESWIENINVGDNSKVVLEGKTFVSDDLDINGNNSYVQLIGQYYGYGLNDDLTKDNSSININGAGTIVDIKDLDTLMLASTSQLATSRVKDNGGIYQNSKNIKVGESISVKSNQLAYLIDDREMADVEGFVSNPMTYEQYDAVMHPQFDNAILNHKLSYMPDQHSYRYYDKDVQIMPVFNQEDRGTVYLYLKFSSVEGASKYFNDLINGDSQMSRRMRLYASQYIDRIEMSKDTDFIMNSNFLSLQNAPANGDPWYYTSDLLLNNSNVKLYDNYTATAENKSKVIMQAESLQQRYTEPSSDGEPSIKDRVSFNSLVSHKNIESGKDMLTQFIIGGIDVAKNYKDLEINHIKVNKNIEIIENNGTACGVILGKETDYQAIVIDNATQLTATGEPFVYDIKNGSGLVIATGDVRIKGKWRGGIVTQGKILCEFKNGSGSSKNPSEFYADEDIVNKVLNLYWVRGTNEGDKFLEIDRCSVANIFKGYQNSKVKLPNEDIDKGIADYLAFENWHKG